MFVHRRRLAQSRVLRVWVIGETRRKRVEQRRRRGSGHSTALLLDATTPHSRLMRLKASAAPSWLSSQPRNTTRYLPEGCRTAMIGFDAFRPQPPAKDSATTVSGLGAAVV